MVAARRLLPTGYALHRAQNRPLSASVQSAYRSPLFGRQDKFDVSTSGSRLGPAITQHGCGGIARAGSARTRNVISLSMSCNRR